MLKKLKDQEENCFAFSAQKTEFPNDPNVKFRKIQNQIKQPFVVFVDFDFKTIK